MLKERDGYCPICRDERHFDDVGYCVCCENCPSDFIVQLVAMPGWQVVYFIKDDDGKVSLLADYAIGVAIVASGEPRWVFGALGTEIFADSLGNFIGAISPEEGVEIFQAEAERLARA